MNARQILDAAGIAYRLRQDEYWALCPFHQEKTPSFSVSDKKQSFYCFGCGAKGSLKSLAKKLNVQVNNFSQKTGVERAEKPAPKIIMPVPPDAPDVERCGLIPNQGRI
ncbi:MAG: CHC2 zinc finger domain-containing protein, partial [Bacteroidia bacterium]|nr:CHC2 zinc finger domain-containing protein [Bacteroidia bacterium]